MKYFSMFSGIGGFEYGIEQSYRNKQPAEIKQDGERRDGNPDERERDVLSTSRTAPLCIGFSEIDKYATKIYKHHFPKHKECGDATRIVWEGVEDFDLFVGGFPCQAFSIAGKRRGFEDTRGTLFFEIARALSIKRPKLCVLENVKGLLSHDRGKTFGTILTTLSDLGYVCEWQILNSKDFGVPQNRERVFIIGHLGRECGRKVFPIGCDSEKINELQGQQAITNTIKARHEADANGSYIVERKQFSQEIKQNGVAINNRIRRLTPTECERLQGFPDGWTEFGQNNEKISDSQRYKCLGNAVTTNVITAIFEQVLAEESV